mgnify:CR=1 FL=1
MSKRINSYQAVAAFVRGFFEAYARGIIDATIEGNDFSKSRPFPGRRRAAAPERYRGSVLAWFSPICRRACGKVKFQIRRSAQLHRKIAGDRACRRIGGQRVNGSLNAVGRLQKL